jgi:UTP--glucose-1-phosphate uridylyltransferase
MADNVVAGTVEPPAPGDVTPLPEPGTAEYAAVEERGAEALRRGEVGLVVLAGGMATRMGGVVKALVEAVDGLTFLDIRLRELDEAERRYGRRPPLFMMTSAATDEPIREALGARVDDPAIGIFRQGVALRETPEGDVFRDDAGNPSEYAQGHGDLVDAFRDSGLLGRFVEQGGRTLMLANLDNLGATVDAAVTGWHLAHDAELTCEVVEAGGDRGGWPVRWNGRPVILEDFRLPAGFDPATAGVFNTNTFHVDAAALLAHEAEWTWFRVEKDVDGRTAIQRERLLGELTSHVATRFLQVPREGSGSRFLPAKDFDELEARRPELRAALAARGILG